MLTQHNNVIGTVNVLFAVKVHNQKPEASKAQAAAVCLSCSRRLPLALSSFSLVEGLQRLDPRS